MATDLTIILDDRPGTLAEFGETLGKAGINIEGIAGFAAGGKGTIHILVEDASSARQALEGIGAKVQDEQDALIIDITDKPGALGEVARKIANAGANITASYLATNTRLVITADDIEKARSAI